MARHVVDRALANPDWKFLLSAIKGLRNGAVYGVKIRLPHALVMTFLFGKGTLAQKLNAIFTATYTHSRNLSGFVFVYKLLTGIFQQLEKEKRQIHVLMAAFAAGYFVFGNYNAVNMQINLYLLSRILLGFTRLLVDKGFIKQPDFPVFPWFAAIVWGVVLWLFEYHPDTLQPSLQSSMTYLYHDSNLWHNLKDFLIFNKL